MLDIIVENLFFWIMPFLILAEFVRSFGKIIFLQLYNMRNKPFHSELLSGLKENHRISILISAHNEELSISQCLDAIFATKYHNKEIIVVDDGSDDKTYEIAKEYASKKLIKLIKREVGGSKAKALNIGFSHSTGDIIVVIDADTLLEPLSLDRISKAFENRDIVAAAGNLRQESGNDGINNILTKLQDYDSVIGIELGRRYTSVLNIILVISGAFGVFRKEIFEKIGRYDVDTLGEDFDLTLKIHKLNETITFTTESVARFYTPNNLRHFIRQRTRWAYSQMQVLLKHKNILRDPKCRLRFKLAIIDMWFMDVIMNFIFLVSIITLISLFAVSQIVQIEFIELSRYVDLLVKIFFFYFISELSMFLYAIHISSRKKDMRLIIMIPLIILVYKPLLRFINLRGYLLALFGKSVSW